jgi:hypothetical protein
MTWVEGSGGAEGNGQGGLKAAQGGWKSAYGSQGYSGGKPGENNPGGKFNREGAKGEWKIEAIEKHQGDNEGEE